MGWRFEHLGYLVERLHKKFRIGVCIDTCHIFVAGYDIRTEKGVGGNPRQLSIKIVGLKHLYAFHVNDSMKPFNSRKDRHAPLGKGEIGSECFKVMMTHPLLREIPKYLETPDGPPLWKNEIAFTQRFCKHETHENQKNPIFRYRQGHLQSAAGSAPSASKKISRLSSSTTAPQCPICRSSWKRPSPNMHELLKQLSTGASIGVKASSSSRRTKAEMGAQSLQHRPLFGTCPEEYPLQKKRHSFEFLRTIAHLRPRTNTQGAVLRIRNALALATHLFFQERDFLYVHTPIVTASDCEGGGEQFLVTALDLEKIPRHSDGAVDFTKDFFNKPAYLTVSGQLNLETLACALSDVYSFGPIFRAENSNTSRHLAEFWMIEPEMAFADLKDDMECAEAFLKYVFRYILKHCSEDMEFFDAFIEKGVIERLRHVAESPFAYMTYTEGVEVLKKSGKTFQYPVEWGNDLQSEHERYLAEEYCKKPVILTDYPAKIKAFYMRANDDGKTVAAMDVLVPKIGRSLAEANGKRGSTG